MNFTWSCTGFEFWRGLLGWTWGSQGQQVTQSISVAYPRKGTHYSMIRLKAEGQKPGFPKLLNADFVQCDWGKCSLQLWEGLTFCEGEWGRTTTHTALVFPDAMPIVPHAVYLWQAVSGCLLEFCCVSRSLKSQQCSLKRLQGDSKKASCPIALF